MGKRCQHGKRSCASRPWAAPASPGLALKCLPRRVWPASMSTPLEGMGKASVDLFHVFGDGLDELQRAELLAAMEAWVCVVGRLRLHSHNLRAGVESCAL